MGSCEMKGKYYSNVFIVLLSPPMQKDHIDGCGDLALRRCKAFVIDKAGACKEVARGKGPCPVFRLIGAALCP